MSAQDKIAEYRRILGYAQTRMLRYAATVGESATNALQADLKWIDRELSRLGEAPLA